MFYKKSKSKELDLELYKKPTKEYRGAPFWAWNTKLEKEQLFEQIKALKDMGFGGFFMHSRSGLNTEYLGDEFMQMIKDCRDKAKSEDMLAYLYDEDKWPSGYAGGFITKNPRYRQKHLYFTNKSTTFYEKEYALDNALPYLIGIYDVIIDSDGYMTSYRKISESDEVLGLKRYAYVLATPCEAWHNGYTPEDAMMSESIEEFIKITYEKYKQHVGDSFGDTVPAIFTDEPQMGFKYVLPFSNGDGTAKFPWTEKLEEEYFKAYGENITDFIPELFIDLCDGKISTARYRYHNLTTSLFTKHYSKQISTWCKNNKIRFTGHMLWEHDIDVQTRSVGDAMRAYEWFDIPGIDLLCDNVEIVTAKQTQSVVRQLAKDCFLTELYGVTNWDFDFRGHKFQGDWQVALGATLRVPHLAWVSMKGSAKRDYPASINYQVPWYKEYGYVEDHFARLGTVLTRGKPIVKVGVIHPIESYWLDFGPENTSATVKQSAVKNFDDLCSWLYQTNVDYDLICEDMIPNYASVVGKNFNVGACKYSTIIVPNVKTLRSTTFNLLKKYAQNGGKLIFLGDAPTCIDAIVNNDAKKLYQDSIHLQFDKLTLFNALKEDKTVDIYDNGGVPCTNFVHQLRQDGEIKWFFLAHSSRTYDKPKLDVAKSQSITIVFDGEYIPTLYDTIEGSVKQIPYKTQDGKTFVYATLYDFDSLLLRLEKGVGHYESQADARALVDVIDFKHPVNYDRLEDNVLLVDICEYKLNDGEYYPEEEILRIDEKVRKMLNYPKADGMGIQPWALPDNQPEHYVTLKYEFVGEVEVKNCFIAGEEATKITFNDKEIDLTPVGYYVDKSIKKYKLGTIKKGLNELLIKTPITHRISIENYYILGDFDVKLSGTVKTICEKSESIGFSDITRQGMPFYGGNIVYKTEIETPNCDIKIRINRYRNALLKVFIDGEEKGVIAYPPYLLEVKGLSEGKHTLEIVAFGNRVNTFGPIHDSSYRWYVSPSAWYTTGYAYSYEYEPKSTGVISSPIIEIYK